MGELEDKINSLLGDPEQLSKLTRMAQSFMGGGGESGAREQGPPPQTPGGLTDMLDPKLLSVLGRVMSKSGGDGGKNELLRAMQPYLAKERREKMDRAIKIARLATLARLALSEYGGEGDV